MLAKSFGSDNHSGVHPKILKAIENANVGDTDAYGYDNFTESAVTRFEKLFGKNIKVYFVFNGTGANVTALRAITKSYHSVIAAETAHINVDECGALENLGGLKITHIKTSDGKLTPDLIDPIFKLRNDEHMVMPKVISISQPSELGTLYSVDEIRELANYAHLKGLYFHIDGARIANATAALDCDIKDFTTDAGVDVLSFGGTKNGLLLGEAVVFFNTELAEDFKFVRKQNLQLASKMRFISAQFNEYLKNDLWIENGKNANKMTKLLTAKCEDIPKIKIVSKPLCNEVFAILPHESIDKILEKCFFYVWDSETDVVRWVTSFNTTEKDINDFVAILKSELK